MTEIIVAMVGAVVGILGGGGGLWAFLAAKKKNKTDFHVAINEEYRALDEFKQKQFELLNKEIEEMRNENVAQRKRLLQIEKEVKNVKRDLRKKTIQIKTIERVIKEKAPELYLEIRPLFETTKEVKGEKQI